jgi:hypothetical protein
LKKALISIKIDLICKKTLEEPKKLNNSDEKKTLSFETVRNFVTTKRIIGKNTRSNRENYCLNLIKFVIHNQINI